MRNSIGTVVIFLCFGLCVLYSLFIVILFFNIYYEI